MSLPRKFPSLSSASALVAALMVCLSVIPLGETAEAQSSGGFAVTPVNVELTGERGQTITREFEIFNNADAPQELAVEFTNFTAGGSQGDQPVFTDEPTGYEMASWMSVSPSKATIAANGGSVKVTLTVKVPDDASPGGHFGGMTVHPAELASSGEVRIDPAVTALVQVTVPGETREELVIDSVEAQLVEGLPDDPTPIDERKSRFIFTKGPIEFAVNVRNNGNVGMRPIINVKVTNQFGSEVANLQFEATGNVLPQSNRIYRTMWEEEAPLGFYRAEATITYGQQGNAVAKSTSFRAAPPWFLGSVAVVLVLLVALIVRTRVRRRQLSKPVGRHSA